MVARSQTRGHDIRYDGDQWAFCKTGFAISDDEPCVLCGKMPGNGGIDPCIAPLINALNNGGIRTVASCCGHGRRPGNIALTDGRELVICRNFEIARLVDAAFPPINNGWKTEDE